MHTDQPLSASDVILQLMGTVERLCQSLRPLISNPSTNQVARQRHLLSREDGDPV